MSLQDAYLSVAEALEARRLPPRLRGRDRVDPGRGGRGPARRGPPARARRHRDPRRLRRAGHRGQDHGGRLRARARHPVPRPVPRAADDDDRVRPQRARAGGRQLERARPHHPAPGDRPHGDAARRHRHGRHDAPRRLRRAAGGGLAGRRGLRHHGRVRAPPPPLRVQPHATAPASTRATSGARAPHPTAGWWSSSSSAATRSGSAPRPIPSSRAGPPARRRCSGSWSAPPWPAPRAARRTCSTSTPTRPAPRSAA